jgi:hypothetical protein
MKITFFKTEPSLLLGFFAVIFLVWGFFEMNIEEAIFYFNIDDQYITMHRGHLYIFFSIYAGLLFGLYAFLQLQQVRLYDTLKKVHIYQTLIAIIGIVFPYSIFEKKEVLLNDGFDPNSIILIFLLLFVLAQLVFIFQMAFLIFNKIRTKVIS